MASVLPALALGMISFGCAGLGGGDLQTWRSISQGRYSRIIDVSATLDRLIARPAPAGLTPQERVAWDQQTVWLQSTRSRLFSFAGNLKVLLDKPAPSGSNDIDRALASAQLASDYARLGDEFGQLMAAVTVEADEDARRVEAATSTRAPDTLVAGRSDTTGRDSAGGELAYSSPLKTRHNEATSSLSTMA